MVDQREHEGKPHTGKPAAVDQADADKMLVGPAIDQTLARILRKLQAEPRPASPPSPGAMAGGLVFGGRFR